LWWPVCPEVAPPAFFVRREARVEVLKYCKPLKGTKRGSPVVFVNFDSDHLCFNEEKCYGIGYNFFERLFPEKYRRLVRRVALNEYGLVHFDCGGVEGDFEFFQLQLDELVIVPQIFLLPLGSFITGIVDLKGEKPFFPDQT